MDSLYIPTSTLNFNNILATESISPEIFYLKRNFGYKRFKTIPPNPFTNYLVAYSKIPIFSIEESELDDYPLVVKISKEIIKDEFIYHTSEKNGISIFYINKTIYLHPNKVSFLFFTEKHLTIAKIKTEPSIETKLLPIYNKKLQLIDYKENSFQWNESYLEEIKEYDLNKITSEINNDIKINRLKGFYFSYLIGILNSLQLNEKHRKEKFSSICESIITTSNRTNCITKSDREKFANKINILIKKLKDEIDKQKNAKHLDPLSIIKNISFNSYKVTQLEDDFFNKRNEAEIYIDIINDLIEYSIYDSQKFKVEKNELVYKIGSIIKKYYPNWEKSDERKYLNNLMDNIEAYKYFDIKSHESILLQSIAAFIQKGDDIEKLINFLEKNEIVDHRIGLGLWGIVFGFSELPKTVTNNLFSEDYIEITKKIYQDIQKKLHDYDFSEPLDFELLRDQTKEQIIKYYVPKSESPKCPLCGAEMILRKVSKGKYKGYEFWGCSNYSNCKGKRDKYLNELDDNFELSSKLIAKLILEYFEQKKEKQCKLNPDIINYIKKETNHELKSRYIKDTINKLLKDKIKIGKNNYLEYINNEEVNDNPTLPFNDSK